MKQYYCAVYEMEQQRMLNVNMQTCNTFIQQHVHVDMHYFNTLILLERGNPETPKPAVLSMQIVFSYCKHM